MNEVFDFFVSTWVASPPIVHGALVLLVGWIVALLVRSIVRRILIIFRFDRFADKVGLGEFLRNGHVTYRPARLISVFVYQLLVLVTFLVASRALNIAAVTSITDALIDYMPAVIAAVFITLIGLAVVKFLCNVIETIARNTSMTNVRTVVNIFRYIGYAVILLLASDQLGFGKSLLSSLLLIAFAALSLGLAIAFGLGSVEMARNAMEDFFKNLGKKGDENEDLDLEGK